MALAGGVLWAIASLMMLIGKQSPVDYTLWFFLWNGVAASLVTLIFYTQSEAALPEPGVFFNVIPWMIPLALLLIIPAGFAVIFGPTQLNPGVAGVLFMVEIGVGTLTANIMTDEPFGWRELLGVLMITLAALIEPARDLIRYRR